MKSAGATSRLSVTWKLPQIAPEVADVDRDARQHLVLHARRELPVRLPMAPAGSRSGSNVSRRRRPCRTFRVADRPALAVGRRVQQVALRDEVAVGTEPAAIVPRSVRLTSPGRASGSGSRPRPLSV